MPKKVSLDQLMNDVLYLTNQIKGLNMLLDQKKSLCKEYFQKSGKRSISNEQLTIYTQEKTKVDYDIEEIEGKIDKDLCKKFIDKKVEILNQKALMSLLKTHGVNKREMGKCLFVVKKVNEDKLRKLFDSGEITIEDLDGCYEANTSLSVALKVKNTDAELKL